MDFPSGFIPFFIQIITGISGFHTCAHTRSGFHHHLGCHCPPNSTGTPPTHLLALCHPHQPPPSQIFVVSPVKTGTLLRIFRNFSTSLTFSALGLHPPHPHHLPTLPGLQPHLHTLLRTSAHTCAPFRTFCAPARTLHTFCTLLRTFPHTFAHPRTPLCTFVHLFAHICAPLHSLCAPFAHIRAPLRTLVHLSMHIHAPPHSLCTPSVHLLCTHAHFALHLPGLSPLSDFLFNLGPPSGYHGQPSPSATGHSAHFQTSV